MSKPKFAMWKYRWFRRAAVSALRELLDEAMELLERLAGKDKKGGS